MPITLTGLTNQIHRRIPACPVARQAPTPVGSSECEHGGWNAEGSSQIRPYGIRRNHQMLLADERRHINKRNPLAGRTGQFEVGRQSVFSSGHVIQQTGDNDALHLGQWPEHLQRDITPGIIKCCWDHRASTDQCGAAYRQPDWSKPGRRRAAHEPGSSQDCRNQAGRAD